MRRLKIVTWILILSIVNFALGAPAAVRERLEMDVAEGGTATSQKRYGSSDDSSITNAAYSPPIPESPGSTESVDSSSTPSNAGSSTGSHPGPTGSPPLPPPHPGPSEDRFPSSWSLKPGTLLLPQPTPPHSPTSGFPLPPLPPLPHPRPSEDRFPSPPGFSVDPNTLPSTSHHPTPPQNPTGGSPLPPLPQPGPSEPPQNPGVDPEIPSLLRQESFPTEFWDDLMKGIIMPRISDSDAVNLAQKDPRFLKFPRHRRHVLTWPPRPISKLKEIDVV